MNHSEMSSSALPQKSIVGSLLGKATIIMAGLAIGAVLGFIVALEFNWLRDIC